MNSTSQDFERFEEDVRRNLYGNPIAYEQGLAVAKRKYQQELEAITTGASACPLRLQDQFRLNISSLDEEKVGTELRRSFYNPELMTAASCAIDAMFYSSPSSQGQVSVNQMLRRKLVKMKLLASGAYGVAASVSLKRSPDVAVEKFPKDPQHGTEDLVHELFVATAPGGINSLRQDVPNFAYVFGGFKCSPPQIEPTTKEITGWCLDSDPNKIQFLLMENISPSVTAASYLARASVTQALSLYLQAIFALECASRKIGFTHYDAHTENLLMRDISATGIGRIFYIPYTVGSGRTYYVQADRVATFIDYGMSGVRVGSEYHGPPDLRRSHLAIFNDKPWPLHDAYKLLMFMIMDAREAGNMAVVRSLSVIFRFFNQVEDPELLTRLTEDRRSQWWHRYSLPYTDSTSKFTLTNLLTYMSRNVDGFWRLVKGQLPTDQKVLRCAGSCMSLEGLVGLFGGSDVLPRPETFFDFYDVGPYLERTFPEGLAEVKKNFPYAEAKKNWRQEVEKLRDQALQLSAGSYRIDLRSSPLQRLATLQRIQRMYDNVFELVRIKEDLELQKRIGLWVGTAFSDEALRDYALKIDIEVLLKMLCELVGHASSNYGVIQAFTRSADWPMYLRNQPALRWYADKAGDILELQSRWCSASGSVYEYELGRDLDSALEVTRSTEVQAAPGPALYRAGGFRSFAPR